METFIGQKVFGNWEIVESIGAGAFGRVYRIKREEFGSTFTSALKVIHIPADSNELSTLRSEGMDDESISSYFRGIVESFISEITILNSLKGNSNIVSYEDHSIIEEDEGKKYTILIRMELLTPLKDYMGNNVKDVKVNNVFDDRQIVKLAEDICRALEICEKHSIIHRDIKPDNIFISNDGNYKIGDFGVARTMEKTMSTMSQKGTYSYMAPEIYHGKPYDKTVDIYSLGIVLYQLLNKNRTPFLPPSPKPITFQNREDARNRRMQGEPIPALNLKNKQLEKIVLKACDPKASNRYQSAGQMLADLKKLSEKPIVADIEEKTAAEVKLKPADVAKKEDIKKEPINTQEKEDTKTVSAVDMKSNADSEKAEVKKEPINTQEKEDTKTVSAVELKSDGDSEKAEIKKESAIVQNGDDGDTVSALTPNSGFVSVQITSENQKPDSVFKVYSEVWKKSFVFSGRTSCTDFWKFLLANNIVLIIASIPLGILGYFISPVIITPLSLYALISFFPSLSVSIRRLHDVDKSGGYWFLNLIPIIGAIVLLIIYIKDGNSEKNKYGDVPNRP